MKGLSAQAMRNYAAHWLGLKSYLEQPGDGRSQPVIAARDLVWGLRISAIWRVSSFPHLEWLAHTPARPGLGLSHPFGDDALAYFTERLDAEVTRLALAATRREAKRNKAFENSPRIGLALDGAAAGRTYKPPGSLCHPVKDPQGAVHGSLHRWVLITVVGTGLTLPVDVEPYGPGDSENSAGQRLLRRTVSHLGPRFANSVVADGKFATAPFLHQADPLGLPMVARRKDNLPELRAAVETRLANRPPDQVFPEGEDRVEV